MKKLLTLLLALYVTSLSAQWQQTTSPGVTGFQNLVESNGKLFAVNGYSPVYRSVSNGLTWQSTTAIPGNNLYNLSMDADNTMIVVLAVDANNTFVAFQSTDDAQSWQQLPSFTGQSTFSDEIFVSNGFVYCYRAGENALLRLDNTTWNPVLSTASAFQVTLAFQGDEIWVGTNNSLQYSADKGDSWQPIITSPSFSWVSSIAVDNNRLVVASDFNVFSSTDNGGTWITGALPLEAYMKCLADDGAYYALSGDKLYHSTDGFQTYTQILSGAGQVRDMASINGFLIASANILYRSLQSPIAWQWVPTDLTDGYASIKTAGGVLFYQGGQPAFSTDDGDTWQISNPVQQFSDIIHNNGTWYGRENYTNRAWTSSNLSDWTLIPTPLPGNNDSLSSIWTYLGNTMVLASFLDLTVYTSNDDGQSWQSSGTLPINNGLLFAYNNQLYVHAYSTNELFKSADFGNSWQEVGTDVFGADLGVYKIEIAAGKIYAISDQNLLVSTDGGLTWTIHSLQSIIPLGSNLYLVNAIAFNGGLIALLTDNSLYLTQDDGLTWVPNNAGLTSAPRNQLEQSGNTVFLLDVNYRPWRRNNFNVNVSQYAGLVYRDLNNNSMPDIGEPALPNAILKLSNSNQYTVSNATGTFNLLTETQNDLLTATYPAKYCQFNPNNYAVNPTNTQLDFGLYCPPGITDLTINMVNTAPFRPGFDTDIILTAHNVGNDASNGTVTLTLDPTVQFVSATPFALQVGNVLTWSFSAFQSLDHASFVVRIKTPVITPLGTVLCHSTQISPSATEQTPLDNTETMCRTVIGSYDPNDKQVDKTAYKPGTQPPLVYTVRFQNTGTYLASIVVIKDTLSPNLDPATLQVLGASHPLTWSLRGNGIVEFRFDGINLPDSLSDEPGSHGFVQFSVEPKANQPLGLMTENTAFIYFDFNLPIITNTVTSTVVTTHEPTNTLRLVAQPNPANESLRLLWPDGQKPGNILMYLQDASGRLVRTMRFEHQEMTIDVRPLKAGTYQVWGDDGKRRFSALFEVVH